MIKKLISAVSLAALLALFSPVSAAPPEGSTATLSTPGTERTLILPPEADNASVISLGTGLDPVSGKSVEGIAFIHYRKGYHHRPGHGGGPGNGGNGGPTNTCFSHLAKDAKWKTVEPWVVNPSNTRGLTSDFVFGNLTTDVAKWEDAGDGVVGNGISVDILGGGSVTEVVLAADTQSPDGVNEVYFADVSSAGAIAVTIVWGIFVGPPSGRELVEWDMVFDDVDFDWSSAGEAGKMDFENIATHELGHSVGMGHPDDSCLDETMYRFADFGETKKRDLNTGDIVGVDKLY